MLFLVGCAQVSEPRTYVARLTRVEERDGAHFSPTRGAQPLYCFHFELFSGNPGRAPKLKVLVLGDYVASRHGSPGDTVSFRSRRELSAGDEVWLEQLDGYRPAP